MTMTSTQHQTMASGSRLTDSGRHRGLAAWLVALVLLATPLLSAQAQPQSPREQAREKFVEGKRLFASGDYRGAIAAFEGADRLSPAPLLDFNIGLAYEQLGESSLALRYYRSYLQRQPGAANRGTVEDKIRRIEATLQDEARKAEEARRAEAAQKAEEERKAEEARREEEARRAAEQGRVAEEARLSEEARLAEETRREEARRAAEAQRPPVTGTGPLAPATTGDAQVDRVAAINVGAVRDQRASLMGPVTPAPGEGGQAGTTFGDGGDGAPKDAKPAYKQWWFWAVVGVSALILLDIASGDSSAAQPTPAGSNGATILRF